MDERFFSIVQRCKRYGDFVRVFASEKGDVCVVKHSHKTRLCISSKPRVWKIRVFVTPRCTTVYVTLMYTWGYVCLAKTPRVHTVPTHFGTIRFASTQVIFGVTHVLGKPHQKTSSKCLKQQFHRLFAEYGQMGIVR